MGKTRLIILFASAAVVPILALIVFGVLSGEQSLLWMAGVLFVGDLLVIVMLSRRKDPDGTYRDDVPGVSTDHRAYREASSGDTARRAEITGVRNTGAEKGVGRFGTEITLRLIETDATGTIRGFFTPAEIAQLALGREIDVKPVLAEPGAYVLAED